MRGTGGGEPLDVVPANHLTGQQKAAVLLVLLGTELSAQLFEYLDDDEIERLSFAIAQLDGVEAVDQRATLAEFQESMLAPDAAPSGGLDYARHLLEKTLGADKAVTMINRVTRALNARPFGFVRRSDPAQVLSFIRDEHPQTIALVLAYLKPDDAAALLASLPYTLQADVAQRIATLERTIPEVVHEVEQVLQHRLAKASRKRSDRDYALSEGRRKVLKILELMDRSTEQTIVDAIREENPSLAEELKQQMFAFEDLLLLDDASLQAVLRDVSRQDLAAALKAVDEEVIGRVTGNMSKRGAALLLEEMRQLGNIRLGAVESAQRQIAAAIRQLEQRGEIALGPHAVPDSPDR